MLALGCISIYKYQTQRRHESEKVPINLALSFDQFVNTVAGGDPDETLSSRFGKWQRASRGGWRGKVSYGICRALHWIDPSHCKDAIEDDEGRDKVID